MVYGFECGCQFAAWVVGRMNRAEVDRELFACGDCVCVLEYYCCDIYRVHISTLV